MLTLTTTTVLFMVFGQSLVVNYIRSGKYLVSQSENGMFGPSFQVLFDLGGLNTNSIREGEIVRLFWAMWMHSGWMHIAFNLLVQLQFLYMMEPDWGFWRASIVFFFSGVTGNLVSAIADPCSTTVGSSGALFGLMCAVVPYSLEYWHSIPRPLCLIIFAVIVLLVSIILGFTGNTDNWAHMGGALGGFLAGLGTITSLTVCETIKSKSIRCWPLKYCVKEEKPDQNPGRVMVIVGPDGRKRKKVIKRDPLTKDFKRKWKQECKCGPREWIARVCCWVVMVSLIARSGFGNQGVVWAVCFVFLLSSYEYQPPGHITFSGVTRCCCCYEGEKARSNWKCFPCEAQYQPGQSWEDFCEAEGDGSPADFKSTL
eukprot:Polyplicarium_translucidae@DN3208_c1_g1_i5.p1